MLVTESLLSHWLSVSTDLTDVNLCVTIPREDFTDVTLVIEILTYPTYLTYPEMEKRNKIAQEIAQKKRVIRDIP